MPKKKIPTRDNKSNSVNNSEPIELRIDLENYRTNYREKEIKKEKEIEFILIKPIGYPMKLKNTGIPDGDSLIIQDFELFQAYAADQWAGLSVLEEEFLFDQMVLPDFAFKILKIFPKDATKITNETEFDVEIEEPPELKIEKVEFSNIIGQEQAKEKCEIIAECIKYPEKFGEWAPKNILFYGPPGTGKTLTARALASETKAKIFAHKGTSLIGLHVGDGANKIHSLFAEARENAPSIIFIDEIDAIGLSRSYQTVRGDVIEVATSLLAEMDGIEPSHGVITIAATNNISLLDPGLRSRFEEEIEFKLPSIEERIDLLKLYFSKLKGIHIDVNFMKIAKEMDGFSGRDIKEKVVKNVVYDIIRNKSDKILNQDLMKSIEKISKMKKPDKMYS